MPRAIVNPDGQIGRVDVLFMPEEILWAPFLIPTSKSQPVRTRYSIGDAIRSYAWVELHKHAPKVVKQFKFSYGDVFWNGSEVVVSFLGEEFKVPPEPGGP